MKQLSAHSKLSFQTLSLELTAHIVCSPSCHGCPEQTAFKIEKLHTSIWSCNKNVTKLYFSSLDKMKLGSVKPRFIRKANYVLARDVKVFHYKSSLYSIQRNVQILISQHTSLDQRTLNLYVDGRMKTCRVHKKNSHIFIVPILLYLVSR